MEKSITVYAKWIPAQITTATVTGTLTTFGDEAAQVIISLLDINGATVAETSVIENSTAYTLEDIAEGNYTLRISKTNHVTRDYLIIVTGDTINQDAEIHLIGDVNGDGNLNAKDKKILYNHIAGSSLLTEYDFAVGDVNGDGSLNAKDKKMVYNHIAGNSLLWE